MRAVDYEKPTSEPLINSTDDLNQQVIDQVVARIQHGQYLMTAAHDNKRAGVIVELVQWLATEPLLVGVAMRKGHEIDPLIRDSRSFALGFIDDGDKFIHRRFSERLNGISSAIYVEGSDPFDSLLSTKMITGSPILPQCSVWIDCEVIRRLDLEVNHELFVGQVVGISCNGETIKIEPQLSSEPDED